MKVSSYFYPFSIYAETKKSKANNEYTSIGICHKTKDQNGQKKEVYFNIIDERDLLVLATACENAYWKINKAKGDEFLSKKDNKQEEQPPVEQSPATDSVDDEIPF